MDADQSQPNINAEHVPVLAAPIFDALVPVVQNVWIDCTLGLGGHAAGMFERVPESVRLIGLDVDPGNLQIASDRLSRWSDRARLFQANFSQIDDVLKEVGITQVDAVLADLGFSSNQMEDAVRGMSFDRDGPLDMRLDPTLTTTAADLVNGLSESELADLIYFESGEPQSRRIARRICAARREAPLRGTLEFAKLVADSMGGRRGKIHPATRTFMALRMAVNQESAVLERLLATLPRVLRCGGRAAIISFHSGEDRRVKTGFRDYSRQGIFEQITRRPIVAEEAECRHNPRSRSAKLRIAERTDAPVASP